MSARSFALFRLDGEACAGVATGLHRTYVSSAERGKRNVGLVNIERLAQALDIEIGDLFDRG